MLFSNNLRTILILTFTVPPLYTIEMAVVSAYLGGGHECGT